jgi:hypothetical protein
MTRQVASAGVFHAIAQTSRRVGVATVVKRVRHSLYSMQLKSIQEWLKSFERSWTQHFNRVKERAEQKSIERIARENESPNPKK